MGVAARDATVNRSLPLLPYAQRCALAFQAYAEYAKHDRRGEGRQHSNMLLRILICATARTPSSSVLARKVARWQGRRNPARCCTRRRDHRSLAFAPPSLGSGGHALRARLRRCCPTSAAVHRYRIHVPFCPAAPLQLHGVFSTGTGRLASVAERLRIRYLRPWSPFTLALAAFVLRALSCLLPGACRRDMPSRKVLPLSLRGGSSPPPLARRLADRLQCLARWLACAHLTRRGNSGGRRCRATLPMCRRSTLCQLRRALTC